MGKHYAKGKPGGGKHAKRLWWFTMVLYVLVAARTTQRCLPNGARSHVFGQKEFLTTSKKNDKFTELNLRDDLMTASFPLSCRILC